MLSAADIAALANVTIGNGSAWQGYFMYVGGTNPGPNLQESIATGYPNDLPEFGYDFHAPIGQSGDLHASAAPLRVQHAFLAAFGDRLAEMTSTLPDDLPSGQDDRATLRWALRSDGRQGVVVVSQHQPYEEVAAVAGAELEVVLDDETVAFPAVDIPAGTIARWPVAWQVGDARVDWATASLVTELPGADGPTLVLLAEPGVAPRLSIDGAEVDVAIGAEAAVAGGQVVVLPASDALRLWVRDTPQGRMLLRTDAELAWDDAGLLVRGPGAVFAYEAGAWTVVAEAVDAPPATALAPVLLAEPAAVPLDYGFGGPRHRAPGSDAIEDLAAIYRLDVPVDVADAVLDIDWAGDVAQLRVDGRIVDDRFWDGERWSVSVADAGITPDSEVSLLILPLSARSTIGLPAEARRRLASSAGDLCALDAVTLRPRGAWRRVG